MPMDSIKLKGSGTNFRARHVRTSAAPQFFGKSIRVHRQKIASAPSNVVSADQKNEKLPAAILAHWNACSTFNSFLCKVTAKQIFRKKRKEKQTKWTRISLSTLSKGEDFNEMWADGKNGRITDDDDERSNRCRCVDVRHCLHAARVSRAGSLEGNCATQLGRRNCAYKMEPTRAGRAG